MNRRKKEVCFTFLFILLFLLKAFLPAFPSSSENLNFSLSDEGIFDGSCSLNTDFSSGNFNNLTSFSLRKGIIDTSLPGESHLTIKGRKVIGLKYTRFNYFSSQAREEKPSSSTEVEQELQIHARGKVGKKISVNLDYDDTAPRTEQQRLSIVYRGDEDEVIKEVAFGDITLSLPRTHFTSYSKSLFGARIKAKWQDFYFTGIGSFTKGISEVKTFTGKTTTEEKEIPDTGYIKRTYFKVFFDQLGKYPPEYYGPFSYTQGSVEVYIDDQDGSNNISGVTTYMQVIGEVVNGATDTYTGYFDLQYPGQDYTVDYSKGIIKFKKQIGEDYVIAVAYKDSEGNRHPSSEGYYMIMKGSDENYFKFRLWNYYYLGSQSISQEDFTFQIKDLSGNIVYDYENPQDSIYSVNIDFDFGIAEVTKPSSPVTASIYYRPFPDAYPPTSQHYYTLYTKYIRSVDVYLLHPDIIPESEKVYVDGRLLTRGKDYIIDYPSGYLSFLDPELIGPDTKIRVEYEWAPLMGGEATFLGGRVEYRPWDNFSLGSTFLSQAASPSDKIPFLGSSPSSHSVKEVDLNLNLKPNIGNLWGGDLPLDFLFAGEVSESDINPNTFGAAMLEDFSSTVLKESLSLDKNSWRLGSCPSGENLNERDNASILDREIPGENVNPSWSSDKIKILTFSFEPGTPGSWDSVTYSLSSAGKDYSNMSFLEIWAKGITGSIEVYVDVGVVSEDIDGDGVDDGVPDTEDKNGDGILNPGEDTGIKMNFPSGERIIGAGNGRLDTEDLDGDGMLDIEENFSTYRLLDDWREDTLSTGWCKYKIPLKEFFAGNSWDEVKKLVKHVRIWAKGFSFSGEIEFARISFLGEKWQKSGLEVEPVNNWDDSDFNPFESSDFRNYYERMFGSLKTSEGKWQKEEALALLALSGDTGYIQQTFLSAKSFSDYRKICFWIYKEKESEGELYLRFGSDVEENYYQYTLPLSSVTQGVWLKVDVPFSELEVKGEPSFDKINQIRIGLSGNVTFPLYINDIYLTDVYSKKGKALRYFVKTAFSNYLTLSGEYEKIDPPFSVIGGESTSKRFELKKWSISSGFLDFLPVSYSRSEQYESTLRTRDIDLTPVEEDKILKKSQIYKANFRFKSFPTLGFTGSNVTSDYLSKDPFERTFEDTYDFSLNYPVPSTFPLFPTNISSTFQYKKEGKKVGGTLESVDFTKKGSITLPFRPLKNMTLKTSYSQSETKTSSDGGEKLPKSRSKELSLTSQLSIFRLIPRVEFKGGNAEESFSSSDPRKRKISTHFNLSLSLPFRPATFFKLPESLSQIGWYFGFNLKKEGIYENTGILLDFPSQFGFLRLSPEDGEEKLWLEKRTFNFKQSWDPASFIKTTISYAKDDEDKVESGTPLLTRTTTWPVTQIELDLNSTPFVSDFFMRNFSSSRLIFKYSQKNTLKEDISTTTLYQPSLSWQGRFKHYRDLFLSYSYTSSFERGRNFGEPFFSKFSSTHKLKFSYSFYAPRGIRIPFLSKIINFESKINLSTTISREFKEERASSGLLQVGQEKWNLATDISYKMTENVNAKIGVNATCYRDEVKAGEDYFSYGGSLWVEIVF